jgi:hypothetical protein
MGDISGFMTASAYLFKRGETYEEFRMYSRDDLFVLTSTLLSTQRQCLFFNSEGA